MSTRQTQVPTRVMVPIVKGRAGTDGHNDWCLAHSLCQCSLIGEGHILPGVHFELMPAHTTHPGGTQGATHTIPVETHTARACLLGVCLHTQARHRGPHPPGGTQGVSAAAAQSWLAMLRLLRLLHARALTGVHAVVSHLKRVGRQAESVTHVAGRCAEVEGA